MMYRFGRLAWDVKGCGGCSHSACRTVKCVTGLARDATSAAGPEQILSPRRATTHRQLLQAAARVFSEHGVPDVTVEMVLLQAGVSRGTFYALFTDKFDLLAALYAQAVDTLHDKRVEATTAVGSGIDCVLRGFDVFTELHARSPRLLLVLGSEALRPGSPLGGIRDDLISRTVEFYTSRFEELEGRPVDPNVILALVLMSDAMHQHMLRTTTASAADIEQVRATVRQVVTRILS